MESNWEIKLSGKAKRFKISIPKRGRKEVIRSEEERPNFENLPVSCIHHIFYFLNYDQVAQLRQVGKSFNEIGKTILNKGHKVVTKKLKKEIERAQESRPVPSLQRYSFQRYHFLKDIYEALRQCRVTYHYYQDKKNHYFVAGKALKHLFHVMASITVNIILNNYVNNEKVLDEVNRLLEEHNSRTMIPFFGSDVYLQKPHFLLGYFMHLTNKACEHFTNVIVPSFLVLGGLMARVNFCQKKYAGLLNLTRNRRWELSEKAKMMKKLVEVLEQSICIEEQMNQQFRGVILKLNTRTMALRQEMQKMSQKLEKLANWESFILIKSQLFSMTSSASHRSTSELKKPKKTFEDPLSIFDEKKLKLETLPVDCLQQIFRNLSYQKLSQLRRVCKRFDKTCKIVLNKGFEKIKTKVEFCENFEDSDIQRMLNCTPHNASQHRYLFKDLKMLVLYCEDTYKYYLDEKYYFSAGKLLDRLHQVVILEDYWFTDDYLIGHEERPNPYLFPIIDLTHQAIGHFRDTFVSMYHRGKCSPKYIPSLLAFGDETATKGSFTMQVLLKIEEMEKVGWKLHEKCKKVKKRNRKSIKLISKLKKSVELLEQEVLEKQSGLNLFQIKVDDNSNCVLIFNKFNKI